MADIKVAVINASTDRRPDGWRRKLISKRDTASRKKLREARRRHQVALREGDIGDVGLGQ
jgi:hypothetical protein